METRHIACNLCEAICGLEVTLDGERIESIRGHTADPLSRGHICPKAIALQDVHTDTDRLRRPVQRDGDTWREIGWPEAFDLVADRLSEIQREHGNDAVGVYLGNPAVHSIGTMTHGIQFVRTLRTRNTFSATSVDQLPVQFMAWLLYGHQLLVPVPDIDRTRYFLVFGGNPMASNGSLMTVPDFPGRLRKLKSRDGRLVVFDPRRTETARAASEHQFIRPGSDIYVLLAMLNILFTQDLVSPASYIDNLDQVRTAVEPFTSAIAERHSGVPEAEIVRIALEFANSSAAAAYGRMGTSTQRHGALCQWALHLLNILTGNLDREGGVMFTRPAADIVDRGLVGRGHFDKWRSRVRGLPEFSGELPVATLADEIITPGDGQIRAFVSIAGNPVSSTPDGKRLSNALSSVDFMVSVDFYVNETTRHADVILPPTGPLERDHYDLIFHSLAVRDTARYSSALFAKPAGARHDWQIFRALGSSMLRHRGRPISLADLFARAKRLITLALPPRVQIDTALRTSGRGLSVRKLVNKPGGVDLGPLRPQLPGRLMTPRRRINCAPPLVLDELTRLATTLGTESTDDGLVLIGRRHQRDNNSWMHNAARLTKGKPRHQLFMHPDDLTQRELCDGDIVEVASRVGTVTVEVVATTDVMRGVVSLPHGYGHQRPGVGLSSATTLPGACVNDLTDPESLDTITGNAALNGVPVTVRACQ